MAYYSLDKQKQFPRIIAMGNPQAANEMIVRLAAGYLAGGECNVLTIAIDHAADAVEYLLSKTGEDVEQPKQDVY